MRVVQSSLCAFLLSIVLSISAAAETINVTGNRDAIRASIAREDGPAAPLVVQWRFSRALAQPLKTVEMRFNDRVLSGLQMARPSQAGIVFHGLVLVDVTGDDEDAVQLRKAFALEINKAEAPDHLIVNAAVADQLLVSYPDRDGGDYALTSMLRFTTANTEPDLTRALTQSALIFDTAIKNRRVIFLITDGRSMPALDVDAVRNSLRALDIAVDVLLLRSGRQSDATALRTLAAETGGSFVEDDDAVSFVADPFRFHDSGGVVTLPGDGLLRYPWESKDALQVSFAYGTNSFSLSAPVVAPAATVSQSVAYLVLRYRTELLIALSALAGSAIALLLIRLTRAPRKSIVPQPDEPAAPAVITPAEPSAAEALAVVTVATALDPPQPDMAAIAPAVTARVVHNLESGEVYPIDRELLTIGRSEQADLRVDDPTVSRLHAELVQENGGWILNQLTDSNETRVNQLVVRKAELKDGDLITLGNTTLYFGPLRTAN